MWRKRLPFLVSFLLYAVPILCWLLVLHGAAARSGRKKQTRGAAAPRLGYTAFSALYAAGGGAVLFGWELLLLLLVGNPPASFRELPAVLGMIPTWLLFSGVFLLGARWMLVREGLWRGLSLRESWRPAVVLVAGDAVVVLVQLLAMPPGVEMICYYAMLCALAGFTADWVARGARTKKS